MDWKKLLFGRYRYENVSDNGKRKFVFTMNGGLIGLLLSLLALYGLYQLLAFLWDKFF